jgi:hypothetical protein
MTLCPRLSSQCPRISLLLDDIQVARVVVEFRYFSAGEGLVLFRGPTIAAASEPRPQPFPLPLFTNVLEGEFSEVRIPHPA